MAEIFINPRKGSNTSPGNAPKRAFQTIEHALSMGLKAGDTLYLMQGETFIPVDPLTPYVFRTNGVTVKPYNTGRASDPPPVIDWPQTDAKDKRGALTLYGSDNTIEGIDVRHALRHVVVMPGEKGVIFSGNTLTRMTLTDWALGIVDYANHTTMTDIHLSNGEMLRDEGKSSDVGASAITLWREDKYEHIGTRIYDCECIDGYAAKKSGGFDSSFIEVFGGIADVDITHCRTRNTVFMEVGGTTARKETASNVLIQRCVCIDPFAKVLFVNKPTGDYFVDWNGFHFDRNVFKADDVSGVSSLYIDGDQGDMSKRLRMTGNTIISQATIYAGGAGTQLETITRSANTYWRTDNGTNVGVALINGDVFQDPRLEI